MIYTYSNLICNLIVLFSILSSFIVIYQAVKSPINSVLWLIIAFISVASYLVTAGITFLGLSYIIVYVGAIAVLFLFVVIILNISNTNISYSEGNTSNNVWPLAIIIVLVGIYVVLPITNNVTPIVDIPFIINIGHSILWGDHYNYININIDIITYSHNSIDLNSNIFESNQIASLGITLYTYGALWLIIISILLILAILVPLALAFTTLLL